MPKWLPNALTAARLVAIVPFTILLARSDDAVSSAAALLFAAAASTDFLDGYLARHANAQSRFGRIADPLADRLLIDVAVILLWNAGRLPWIALVIPLRDVLLLVGYKPAVDRGNTFEVNRLGKAATWLLYASLGFTMVTVALPAPEF